MKKVILNSNYKILTKIPTNENNLYRQKLRESCQRIK